VTGQLQVIVLPADSVVEAVTGAVVGPYIDMQNAQPGDVLEVAPEGHIVPTRTQRHQIYDGGNF